MSIKKKMLAAGATLAIAAITILASALSASAATPACGAGCLSVFSRALGGTPTAPKFVEDILGGEARVGQPVGLNEASRSDPSEDILPRGGMLSEFYAAGVISAAVNQEYEGLTAVQQEYAPFGVRTGLCVGLASVAYQTEGLTLQPCSVSATTVWIVDPKLSMTTPGYFPIINASTTDLSHPFAMDLPRDELVSPVKALQMQVRRLQFLGSGMTLPDRQLWGVHMGPLN